MTIYQTHKVFWETTMDDAKCDLFCADPAKYLEGRDLSTAERRALIEKDCGALYALGGHPFILFHFVFRTGTPDKKMSMPLFKKYMDSIQPHGNPDFAT